MLRKLRIVICLLYCLFFSGCGIMLNRSIDEQIDDKHPYFVSEDTRDLFVECLKNADTESISKMFCEEVPVSADEIDVLFENIEGEIISIDNDGINSGLKESRDGRYTIYTYAAVCVVYTDIGKEYTFSVSGNAVWEEIPSRVGLDSIMIRDEQSEEIYGVGLWKVG